MTDGVGLAGLVAVLATLVGVLAQVLSALLERSGPIRLRHWAEESGGRLLQLYELPIRFEVYRSLLSWLSRLSPIWMFLAYWMLGSRLGNRSVVVGLGLAAIAQAFTEMLNRFLVGRDPEGSLRFLTPLYRAFLVLAGVLVWLLAPFFPASVVERREDEDEVTDDEIEAYIHVGTKEGILEPGEGDLILNVLDFGDTVVRSVMTPRIDIVCASLETELNELAELFISSKHSRLPIYRDTVDQIVGILHIRDLFRGLREGNPPSLVELVLDPYFVPESKPLTELLAEFQTQRQQLAIVVDEYGGTAGIVTVEDLLEEIVGEIEDEHDEVEVHAEALPDGGWKVDGRVALETLDELFDVEADEEPYETIGGLIFGVLGYVPEPGETLRSHGLRMKVEEVDGRRIRTVVVHRDEESRDE